MMNDSTGLPNTEELSPKIDHPALVSRKNVLASFSLTAMTYDRDAEWIALY